MEIKIVSNNKKDFLDMLLLADEDEGMIDRYLERGTMFALYDDGVKCECVVTDEGNGVFEIQNIAVRPDHQGKGYGSAMLGHVCAYYKGICKTMLVGTGDSPLTLAFYEKNGFKISHRVKNYIVDNYPNPIFENGVQLFDKVYLKKELE